jgi:hypothetical protein
MASCQAKLTEEQKKELREGMEANEIVKISQAEITNAAFSYGRKIAEDVKQTNDINDAKVAELQEQYHVTIFPLEPGDSLLLVIEQQLIEAYTSAKAIELTDNVQKVGKDSLLYTSPIMTTLPDGSLQFQYALGIRMPLKEVILSIGKN